MAKKPDRVRIEDLPELMTLRDVVRLTKLDRKTVLTHIQEGRLPAFFLGGSRALGYRMKREDVERWLLGRADG